MGDRVDQEMANSQRGTDIETEAARQSHYIEWARIIGISDPWGPNVRFQIFMAIYIKFLQSGVNYCNRDNLQSMTLLGYAKAIKTLFTLHTFKPPVDLNDKNNMAGTLINNLIKEENIAMQRSPLNNDIFAQIQQAACTSNTPDLDHSLLLDIVTLSRYIGPCVSKYAQTTQSKIDYHTYPSGGQVIKAFIADNFALFNAAKRQLNFAMSPIWTWQIWSVSLGAFKRIHRTTAKQLLYRKTKIAQSYAQSNVQGG